jgi:hypothetical protein
MVRVAFKPSGTASSRTHPCHPSGPGPVAEVAFRSFFPEGRARAGSGPVVDILMPRGVSPARTVA